MTATAWQSFSYAQAVLAVGAVVLILSVAWRPLRGALLKIVPEPVRERVPVAG
jgi:hypothetical protein